MAKEVEISERDLKNFTEKLQEWGRSLPLAERVLLQEMAAHARFDLERGEQESRTTTLLSDNFRRRLANALHTLTTGQATSDDFWAQWAQRQY